MKFNINELILDLKRCAVTEIDIDGQFVEIYIADKSDPDNINQVVCTRHHQLKNYLIAQYAEKISGFIKAEEPFDFSVEAFYSNNMITKQICMSFLQTVGKPAMLSIEKFLCIGDPLRSAYLYFCQENVDHYERPVYVNKLTQYIILDTVAEIPLFNPELFKWAKSKRLARLRKEKHKTELQTAKAI